MISISVFLCFFVCSVVIADLPVVQQEQLSDENPIQGNNFDCQKRNGYFADVLENCQVFHVCKTTESPDGISSIKYSFNCPQGTYFDQQSLTCAHQADCLNSERFYSLQDQFFSHQDQFEQQTIADP